MVYKSLVYAALLISVGCKPSAAPAEDEPLIKPVDIDDPQSCAPCHALGIGKTSPVFSTADTYHSDN